MKTKCKFIWAAVFGTLFFALLALVKFADVAAIGPEGTKIGLSALNRSIHNKIGLHMSFFTVTEWLGYLAIGVALVFAIIGFCQMIKRKSLLKVDGEIITLGALYIFLAAIYVFFEKVIINYRPVIMPEDLHVEASFPSSHTMLSFVIFGAAAIVIDKYVKSEKLSRALKCLFCLLIAATVILRFLSGVHWFTDIVAGALISLCLLYLFSGALDIMKAKKSE